MNYLRNQTIITLKSTWQLKYNQKRFLDTKAIYKHDKNASKVFRNDRKLQVYWTSKVPYRYKGNPITSDLNRAVSIVSNHIAK